MVPRGAEGVTERAWREGREPRSAAKTAIVLT